MSEAFALHSLTEDERNTGETMLSRNSTGRLMMMPTHHFGDYGDLTGFRYDCSGGADGSCLPISRRMFYGHTMVECLESEGDILNLMSRQGDIRDMMRSFLADIESKSNPALFDCIPDNSDAITGHGIMQVNH
jgi:hypothetical protein